MSTCQYSFKCHSFLLISFILICDYISYGLHMDYIYKWTAAAAESLRLCPTLRDPIDGSPPGSPIPGILQARTLEWVAISFSNTWKWKVKVKSLSCVRLLATPWTAAYQAPLSVGFSRQEYWSGLPLPSPINGLQTPQKQESHVLCSPLYYSWYVAGNQKIFVE